MIQFDTIVVERLHVCGFTGSFVLILGSVTLSTLHFSKIMYSINRIGLTPSLGMRCMLTIWLVNNELSGGVPTRKSSLGMKHPTHRQGEVKVTVDDEKSGNTAVFGSQR